MAGEEVVGGVVGFLRMDADQFHREIKLALAEVKLLSSTDAKVKVKVDNAQGIERDLTRVSRAAQGVGRDVDRMGGSFKGLRDPRVIVGAIATGMSLLGPVTGAATAALGGFVGVAGTAILAFKGFQKEIKDGTALGNTLKGSLGGVGEEFNALAATASHAMSGGVLASLSAVHDFLPTLNPEVATLGHNLGNALRISTSGLIVGLQNAMPLLQDGGRYAEIFAEKLADFAYSQDFKDFIDYARRELPNVGEAMLSLAGGVKDLAVALAPVGDDLIELIHVSGQFASAVAPVISFLDKVRRASTNNYQFVVTEAMKNLPPAADAATQSLQGTNTALESMTNVQTPLATALGTTDAALAAARDAHIKNADAAANATAQMQYEGDAAGLLKQALDQLNGKALNVASTQNAFDSALANSNKHIAANGKTIDRATTSLAGNSAAAVANRGELIRQVKAAEDVATAYRDNGKSADETSAKMKAMRDQILKNADAHGLDRKAVEKFIDQIYKIPKKVPPTRLEVQTKTAMDGIAAFQKAINSLHGKSVTASVHYAYTGRLPNGGFSMHGGTTMDSGATGGLIDNGIRKFSGGGLLTGPGTGTSDSILAAIAGTKEMIRVANGEFISTAASQRRNRAALEAGNRGATLTTAGGGGTVRLAPGDIAAIAAAVSRIQLRATVSPAAFDAAMGWA